jgi:hypothetical protein
METGEPEIGLDGRICQAENAHRASCVSMGHPRMGKSDSSSLE